MLDCFDMYVTNLEQCRRTIATVHSICNDAAQNRLLALSAATRNTIDSSMKAAVEQSLLGR